jgi:hypothetical protein
MDDDSELRLEVLHMAFDLLMTHGGPFAVMDAITVADSMVAYVQTGNRPAKPEQPTIN